MARYISFTELPLWNEAIDFAVEIYQFVKCDQLRDHYRMKEQMRAAAASVSNNIAEGFEYNNPRAFARFLHYAKGSAGEVYNQFTILYRAGYISNEQYEYFSAKALKIGRKIGGLIQYLNKNGQFE